MPAPRWMGQATSEKSFWSRALGGTRGIVEVATPGLFFVIASVATCDLLSTLITASTIALIAYIIRFVQHQGIG